MKKRWEVVLQGGKDGRDRRVFCRTWTRSGAENYMSWLKNKFPEALDNFFEAEYQLFVRRISE